MAIRRALTPVVAVGSAYVAALVGFALLVLLIGEEYQHSDNLNRGIVLMAWSLLSLVAVVVSCTALAYVWRQVRWWLRLSVGVLNLLVVLFGVPLFLVSVWSLQDYSASQAAYDTATEVCGANPVIAQEGFGGKTYIVPGGFDYDRQRYTTRDRFIFGGTRYFCTAEQAEAAGYRRFP